MNSHILFIDTAYFILFNINTIKLWFKNKYPNTLLNDPTLNTIFMNKYNSMFFKNIQKLIKNNQFNIPTTNMFFTIDCPLNNLWRRKLYLQYKNNTNTDTDNTREDILCNLYNYTYETLIPTFCKDNGSHIIKIDNAEAIDIISISSKYFIKHNPNIHIVIIANDLIYLQLINNNNNTKSIKEKEALDFMLNLLEVNDTKETKEINNNNNLNPVTIINLKNKKLNEKNLNNNLLFNVLSGNPEFNISPAFNYCTKAIIKNLINDPLLLEKYLVYYGKKQYDINCSLFDFNNIPCGIQNNVRIFSQNLNLY